MKKLHILIASALALAVVGVTTLRSAEDGPKQAKATIRAIHGGVFIQTDNGGWMRAKVNQKLDAGVVIRTDTDGTADLSVNGNSSAVRLTNNTILQIPTMLYVGSPRDGDTSTMLNLETGGIIGNVKKISADSRYEIMTPHGVAGIRGTDFSVIVIPLPNGKVDVTFNSITGIITVSAVINGVTVTHTLTTGTSWEIGENPQKMTEQLYQNWLNQILNLIQFMETPFNPLNPGRPPGPYNPNPPPPFPGGPPQGPQSS